MFKAILAAIIAYLIGSINFAVIFGKLFMKTDVRSMGSGNAGTTNVMRNGGFLPGALTFIFDALKGLAAVLIGELLFENIIRYDATAVSWAKPIYGAYLCGTLCMLGHIFPVFFQFKGGKGVATSVGIFSVCSPIAIISGLCVFAVTTIISKFVSLASLLATVTVVVLSIIFYDNTALLWPQALMAIIMGTMVFLKHKDNIKRLIAGNENKIGGKKRG